MSSADVFTMAVRNLFKRKTRTILTILGVVIGTSAIVVMVSLGLAMNKTFDDQLSQLGDITVVTVNNPEYYGRPGVDQPELDDNAIASFKRLPGVVTATPVMQLGLIFTTGKYTAAGMNVKGISPEAMSLLGYQAVEGRLLGENDRLNVVFGANALQNFWNPKRPDDMIDPSTVKLTEMTTLKMTYDWRYYDQLIGYASENTGDPIKLYNIKCVGVLAPRGDDADYSIFMDINQLKKLSDEVERWNSSQSAAYGYNMGTAMEKDKSYDMALVKCEDLDTVEKIKDVLDNAGYPCSIPSEMLDSMKNIASSLQGLLAAIGAVSLFVAMLGITNTMVTAIYERTREIGIMKVVGASLADIRHLFLTEAAIIGFLGGVIGVCISLGISYFLNTSGINFLSSISEFSGQTTMSLITKELCGLAVLFSTLMGVIAGYFPARRAMRLSALSAITTN